jgi:DNA-binding MarR family transcriptional regulator/SAM-dependent methyltransferase
MNEKMMPGLGELLRHLCTLVDRGAEQIYQQKNLNYRPRFTPVMRALADGDLLVSEITDRVSITQSAISQSLKLMEQEGLVNVRRGGDARQSIVSLTRKGKKILVSLQSHWQATFNAIDALETEIDAPLRSVLTNTIAALEQSDFAERIQQARSEDASSPRSEKQPEEAEKKASEEKTQQRQSHFQSQGDHYARYRPTYPETLVDQLRQLCPETTLAIDVGCGNGQLSTLLAEQFDQVIATDVSESQLANAWPRLNIDYRCEGAETISAEDHSADLIVAAQAAHWFDLPAFYQEVRRVSKPGAVIALVSYGVPMLDGAANAGLQRFYWQTLGKHWPPERRFVETGYRTLAFPFTEITPQSDICIVRQWNLQELMGYLGTWSATRAAIAAGEDQVLEQCEADLTTLWGDPESTTTIRWQIYGRIGMVES